MPVSTQLRDHTLKANKNKNPGSDLLSPCRFLRLGAIILMQNMPLCILCTLLHCDPENYGLFSIDCIVSCTFLPRSCLSLHLPRQAVSVRQLLRDTQGTHRKVNRLALGSCTSSLIRLQWKLHLRFIYKANLKGIYAKFQVIRGFSQKVPADLLSYDKIHS